MKFPSLPIFYISKHQFLIVARIKQRIFHKIVHQFEGLDLTYNWKS